MSERLLVVDLFVEDRAHEELLQPLVRRVARDEGVHISLRVRAARGGHARALAEFGLYQTIVARGHGSARPPDLVVVGVDGNCTTAARRRQQVQKARQERWNVPVVAACRDPHVERWYLADPATFAQVVGYQPVVGRKKCQREHYKALLADAVRQGDHPPTLGGIEFAAELVAAMDLYRAGRTDRSLDAFLKDLRATLRGLAPAPS